MTVGIPSEVAGTIYIDRVTGIDTKKQILRTVAKMVDWALDDEATHDNGADEQVAYPRTAEYCNDKQDLANALGLSGFPVIWNKAIVTSHHAMFPDDDGGMHAYVTVRALDLSWIVRVLCIRHSSSPDMNKAEIIDTWGVNYELSLEWFSNAEKQLSNY
jgi:hypothetical protein